MRTSQEIREELERAGDRFHAFMNSGEWGSEAELDVAFGRFSARAGQLREEFERAEDHGGVLPVTTGERDYARNHPRALSDGRGLSSWGFADATDFVRAVAKAALGHPHHADPRLLRNAISTYSGEGAGPDGGYAVPPDFRTGVQRLLAGPDSLFPLLAQLPTDRYTVTIPTDEDPPWSTAGLVAAQVAEGTAPTAVKPVVRQLAIPLIKYSDLIFASEEIIADSPGFGDYLLAKAADKISWKLNLAVYSALLAAPCKITTPKGSTTSGQPPSLLNIQAMLSNMAPAWRHDAIWLANGTATMESALQGYTVAGWPVFLEAGVNGNQYPILFGRRVIFSEVAAANGTEGDLVLFSPSMIYGASRSDSAAGPTSIHLAFDQDLIAFRAIVRAAIKPKLSGPVTRPDSSTVSPIITCQSR